MSGGLTRRIKGSAASVVTFVLVLAASGQASAAPGDLDPGFGRYGVQGIAFSDEPHAWSDASFIGTQPSGLPVLAGAIEDIVADRDIYEVYRTFAAAKLSDQGTLDPGFGDGGLVVGGLGLGFGEHDYISDPLSSALAADGSIIVGGSNFKTFSLARLSADGVLDHGFGGDGVASFSLPEPNRFAHDGLVGVLSDGSVILAGVDVSGNSFDQKLILIKFTADGILDRSFGTNGRISSSSEPWRAVNDLVVDSEDRILISDGAARGVFEGQPESISEVTRLLPDGQPDTSFGTDGTKRVFTPVSDGIPYPVSPRLAIDGDHVYTLSAPTLTRLNEDGSLDVGFGTDGTVELPAGLAGAVYPDPGDGVFLAGTEDAFRGGWRLTTALRVGHLLENGDMDPGFGDRGWSSTYHDGPIWDPSMLVLAPGELTVAASGRSLLIARYQLEAGGGSDVDADGVEDERDRCPERSGSGRSGCPAYSSSIRLLRWSSGRRPGRLRGVVGEVSADSRCLVQREIRVFTRRGRRLVGSITTSGPYPEFFVRIGRRVQGRIFAVARGFRDPRLGVCQSSRSEPFEIPRKR